MSKFSQQHYVAIAEVIFNCYAYSTPDEVSGIDQVRERLIRRFQADNPRFKESTFRKACKP